MEFLQTMFYTVGIIFMTLGIVIFVFVIYVLWRMEKGVAQFKKNAAAKAAMFMHGHKSQIFGVLGAGIVSVILKKLKDRFGKE